MGGAGRAGLDIGEAGLHPNGRIVNAINPGPVATDLWLGTGDVAAHAVVGRFTRPAEVVNLLVFLVSNRGAGNITGAAFDVDGGYSTETH